MPSIKTIFVAGFLLSAFCSSHALSEEDVQENNRQMADRRLGHAIRNAIVEDASLPYCAHLISVKAEDGVVTLKGRVHTKADFDNVRKKAAHFAGSENVYTDIRIKGHPRTPN